MKDKLKVCPCGKSDACYEQSLNSFIKAQLCYGCGFWSNSIMREGQLFLKEQKEVLPELYKEIMWTDDKGQKWIPKVTNLPEQGMIFMHGTNINDIKWRVIKVKEVAEEEREKFKVPNQPGKYYKYKMDNTTMKEFDRYNYIDALTYLGVLPEDQKENE